MLLENKKYEVYTVSKCKIVLYRDNGKRHVEVDAITTLSRVYLA